MSASVARAHTALSYRECAVCANDRTTDRASGRTSHDAGTNHAASRPDPPSAQAHIALRGLQPRRRTRGRSDANLVVGRVADALAPAKRCAGGLVARGLRHPSGADLARTIGRHFRPGPVRGNLVSGGNCLGLASDDGRGEIAGGSSDQDSFNSLGMKQQSPARVERRYAAGLSLRPQPSGWYAKSPRHRRQRQQV
jgi:hypothetical protein